MDFSRKCDSWDQLFQRITVLKMKIKGRLKLSHGDEITPTIYKDIHQEIFEYLTEVEICNCKLEISSPSDNEREETESNRLISRIALCKELEHLNCTWYPQRLMLVWTNIPLSFSGLAPGGTHSSFLVRLPQVWIIGRTFNGQEMEKECMSFHNSLSRFKNCVASMANATERLSFWEGSLSERPLLLINPTWVALTQIINTLYFKRRISRCGWNHW